MVGAFCARLGWTDLESLVTKFQQRVFFGVRPEVSTSCQTTLAHACTPSFRSPPPPPASVPSTCKDTYTHVRIVKVVLLTFTCLSFSKVALHQSYISRLIMDHAPCVGQNIRHAPCMGQSKRSIMMPLYVLMSLVMAEGQVKHREETQRICDASCLCVVAFQVLALTEITGVKGARARLLYKAGIRTPEAVAATGVDRYAWDRSPPRSKRRNGGDAVCTRQRATCLCTECMHLSRDMGRPSVATSFAPLSS